jgi:hypothetical protein
MKIHKLLFSTLLINGFLLSLISFNAFAGWQVTKPDAAISADPFFLASAQHSGAFSPSESETAFSNPYANFGPASPIYAVSISGSLKENLERILGRYHWKVIWKAPYDYNFDGRVTGASLPNVVEKLLKPFPLQAVMYMANRTIAIVPKYNA